MDHRKKAYSDEELELLADVRYLEIERQEEEARKAAAADEFWELNPSRNEKFSEKTEKRPKKEMRQKGEQTRRENKGKKQSPPSKKQPVRRKKEKTPLSERFIKRVGTLLGVLIVLLVVLVIFGGDLIAGIFGNSRLASKE